MEFPNNHPLDAITKNNPYSMLEALIPFVDSSMKLALALIVKYYEVKMILNAFKSNDIITAYGLHKESKDPMDMIAGLTGMSPDMLKTIMSVMQESGNSDSKDTHFPNVVSLHNTNNTDTGCSLHNTATTDSDHSLHNSMLHTQCANTDNDRCLDDNIYKIFADYDLIQAAEYNKKERFT
ncbi:MAG: hypothetical protein E7271_11070 [Lachnospiraceae bacterium]|jgi:hypothetical protein|nr:hypothetical protein [Lachnospiraceae bacterium]